MLEYKVNAKRVDTHGSVARCKAVEIVLDTDVDGPARRLGFRDSEGLLRLHLLQLLRFGSLER